jgi:hypothetical protein
VETLLALTLGLLALTLLFGLMRSIRKRDDRLDAAATRVQSIVHVRDALGFDVVRLVAEAASGRRPIAVREGGRELVLIVAERAGAGPARFAEVVWRFDGPGRRVLRAGQPLAVSGVQEMSFALPGELASPREAGSRAKPWLEASGSAGEARGPSTPGGLGEPGELASPREAGSRAPGGLGETGELATAVEVSLRDGAGPFRLRIPLPAATRPARGFQPAVTLPRID